MWAWIKSLFKKKQETPVVKPQEQAPVELPVETKPSTGIKKIAILVGHGAGDSGAICYNGTEEHNYNLQVAKILLSENSNKELSMFLKSPSGWVSTYLKVALFNPDLTIELHLNAATGSAVGCEVLCLSNDEKSAEIGRSFAKAFTGKFGRKLRREQGINFISAGDRGYGNIKGCKALSPGSILVEPFFCDNKNEWIEPVEYAKFVKEWLNNL